MIIDAVTLTIPNERRFFAVPRLLVGGLAVRQNLPYEQLDDLQLAVESVLARRGALAPEVTIRLAARAGAVVLELGPVMGELLGAEAPDPARGLSLDRLLATLVDEVGVVEADGSRWLRLAKAVSAGSQG